MSMKRDFVQKVKEFYADKWDEKKLPQQFLPRRRIETSIEALSNLYAIACDRWPRRPADVYQLLKGMHVLYDGQLYVCPAAVDFYLETGKDPYMHWGVGMDS